MDRELDNANPTIFAPTASGSKRQKSPKALLWSEDVEGYTLSEDGSSEEEREDIDAEEVFGRSPYTCSFTPWSLGHHGSHGNILSVSTRKSKIVKEGVRCRY
jgi:hypothetical protein